MGRKIQLAQSPYKLKCWFSGTYGSTIQRAMTMILFIALKMALPSAPWCSGSHPQDTALQQDPSRALLFYTLTCPAKTQRNSRVLS